jgi:RND family efflux transporter MFP subunit
MKVFSHRLLSIFSYRGVLGALLVLSLAACRSGGEGGAGAPGGAGRGGPPMAMPVEAITLTARPVELTTEYVATVKSRRSTTMMPQVEGYITRIIARPGQRVARGAVLMEIDSRGQQATVANLESVRAARVADVQWAKQQADRQKRLLDVGAVSQQDYEQAATAVQTSDAQLKAVDAQIQEQQVELAYYRVIAPTAGVVGDIPVRVGDRVTRATMLTTIDENAGLELYINIPVAQAPQLKAGMPVRIIDDAGKTIAATAVNFISPTVDMNTQSVLIKAPLQPESKFRSDQFVRTTVVWSTEPSLTVPLVSVLRINAQYFVYVVEKGDNGMTVAKQRPVQLGTVVGNDYVVQSGLKAGEQLVTAGVQKIADGMPVKVEAAQAVPATPSAPSGTAGER